VLGDDSLCADMDMADYEEPDVGFGDVVGTLCLRRSAVQGDPARKMAGPCGRLLFDRQTGEVKSVFIPNHSCISYRVHPLRLPGEPLASKYGNPHTCKIRCPVVG
jgi:hypothetical protein